MIVGRIKGKAQCVNACLEADAICNMMVETSRHKDGFSVLVSMDEKVK